MPAGHRVRKKSYAKVNRCRPAFSASVRGQKPVHEKIFALAYIVNRTNLHEKEGMRKITGLSS